MCWRVEYLILILISTLIDYVAGLLMGRTDVVWKRRVCLLASLTTNLGLLFLFKYFNFFNASVAGLFESLNAPYKIPSLEVLLPVGISFYTFQTLSYTIDVYRGARKPEKHLGYFALYVAFFPQLVAGPIERSTRLLPQFFIKHRFDFDRVRSGLLLMGWGFFKKLVIADRLGIYVNEVYSNPFDYQGLPIVVAMYFFAFQIFCDFSGYSDIAIGSARVLGYDVMKNFDMPFATRTVGEFWNRWHISLSSWFRDYVYIPLGGNRVSRTRWLANIMVVFVLSGLWHGANWTFLFWGFLHGCFVLIGTLTKEARKRLTDRLFPGKWQALHSRIQIVITYHLFALSMVFFGANTFTEAVALFHRMPQNFSFADPAVFRPLGPIPFVASIASIVFMEVVHAVRRRGPVTERLVASPLPVRWAAYCAVGFGILIFGSFTSEEFVYFQF
jgi:D-alanyl-lipoteichoic acid acyltransferase DltB (MBOAT superfamily)